MQYVIANGAAIPTIGVGTWTLKHEVCSELVADAPSLGYRHVDTAAYCESEREIGEGLRASGVTLDEVCLTTEVWPSDTVPADLERAAEASLKRFGLDAVDPLLIHWPRTDRHSLHPDHCGCEMDEAGKVVGSPVMTGRQASEVFGLAEAALDAVTLLLSVGVARNDDPASAV